MTESRTGTPPRDLLAGSAGLAAGLAVAGPVTVPTQAEAASAAAKG
ncbi:hypothetical protein [Azospirillum sp. ST 5-10]